MSESVVPEPPPFDEGSSDPVLPPAGGTDYGADSITVLEGLEAVRKRPGMYIGSTGPRGLHHLVYEVVDNSVDEAMAGRCSAIEVRLLPDGGVRVADDGRGIPVAEHPTMGKSALEVVLTVLHAGGKFDSKAYAVSGGLHGVGISVVNALSVRLVAEIRRDAAIYRQTYTRGVADGPVEVVGATDEGDTGTVITFWPDAGVFTDTLELSWETLATRFRETAFLTAGLAITMIDQRPRPLAAVDPPADDPAPDAERMNAEGQLTVRFHYEGGLTDFVRHLTASKEHLHDDVIAFTATDDGGGSGDGPTEVEVAMRWSVKSYFESIHTFANTINTHEGGTHEEGFRRSLSNVIGRYAREANLLPTSGKEKDLSISGEDIREGLTAIVSVKLGDPQFEGQTKTRLGNTHVRSVVETACNTQIRRWLEEHPNDAKRIVAKAVESARARHAARAARDLTRRKGLFGSTSLPGKLADCTSKIAEDCEIFIVEGDSAGGSSKMARDRATQAILPIRGKILNVEKARLAKILENKEIQALITAIGTGIGEEFDISGARYHKIVMLMDADVDGAHIRTLVLTFAFRHMRELIEAGFVYIAQPPLYAIEPPGSKNKDKSKIRYAYSDEERDREIAELAASLGDGKKPKVSRFKGLGEMDAEQLWDTTMDPEQRVMLQVTMADAARADEMFSILMGDDVESRRDFIVRNARDVRFLDV